MEYGKDYYGFVYKWVNQRNNKYYIGSHFGSTDDGYIGSGIWFRRAYEKEPENFTRTILEYLLIDDHEQLLNIEQKYLMEVCEVGNKDKCYNISRSAGGGWQLHGKTQEEIDEVCKKISSTLKNKSPEEKALAIEKARKTISENPEKLKLAIEKGKQTKKRWSDDRRKLMAHRMQVTIANNPEKLKAAVEKCRETKSNWTKEEREQKIAHLRGPWTEERKRNHREKLKLKSENRSEEEKQKVKENRSNAQLNRNPEDRKKSYEKGSTKFKNRTQEQKEESNQKRLATLKKKQSII